MGVLRGSSRAPWEPREVGLALLEEGRRAFVRFIRRVEEAGGVAGELLQAGEPVRRDKEGRLQEADRRRTHRQDLGPPLDAFGFEVGQRDDVVDEAHLECLPRVIATAQEPDLLGLPVADKPGEQADPEPGIERADLRADLPEDRVFAGDREIADDLEDLAATDRVAVDEGDDGDGQRSDLALEVQHIEPRKPVAPDVPASVLEPLVAARAERLFAGAREEGAADRRVVPDPRERVDHLLDRLGTERVVDLGPVDRHPGDPRPRMLVADVLVFDDRCPGHGSGSHAAESSSRKSVASVLNLRGDSMCGVWPACSMIARRAPGMRSAMSVARSRPAGSRAPAITSVGATIPGRRSRSGSIAPCPAPRRLVARPRGRFRSRPARRRALRACGMAAWLANTG